MDEALRHNQTNPTEQGTHCRKNLLQMQYSVTRKHQEDGYKFGYRHQFGQITLNYAKLHEGKDLGLSR